MYYFWTCFLFILTLGYCSEIEIVNHLHEHLSLQNSKNDIISRDFLEEKFPFLRSTCVKDALQDFLPICLKQGIESVETSFRVETAVKLSICEFKESGLKYIPDACDSTDVEAMMDCMIQLESSAQWWTTYSGNYQRLPAICFENSLPYEKEQILALFLNITDAYGEINENITAHLYQIISKVEIASEKHFENVVKMFNEYLDDMTKTAKSHEMNMKDDFEMHKDDMHQIIIQNSEIFSTEIQKRDVELMHSMHHVQDIIADIANELKENDIAAQIRELKLKDLDNWRIFGETSIDMLKVHSQSQNEINDELQEFFYLTRENIAAISKELAESQGKAVKVLENYDEVIQNAMLPTLLDFQDVLLYEWKHTTAVMYEDVALWNNEVSQSFETLSLKLNNTMEKVEDLNQIVSKLRDTFAGFSRIIELAVKMFQYAFKVVRYILSNRILWTLMTLTLLMTKINVYIPFRSIISHIARYAQLTFKWTMILIAIYMGSRFGALIVSKA